MSGYSIGRTVIIHKDRFAYNMGPSITILDNGEWLVGFNHSRRREKRMHPPTDPLFRNLLTRSSDSGETWEEPYIAPGFDWSGVEVPGLSHLSNGTVVLTQFRWGWYPLGLARKRRAAGEHISISLPGRGFVEALTTEELERQGGSKDHVTTGWTDDFTDDDWDRSQFSWARGYRGLYAHLSTDGGHTFEDTIKIDCSPYGDGFTRTGVVELRDGRVAYMVTGHHHWPGRYTYILFSSTGGQSWDPPILVVDAPDLAFVEPHIAEVAPGEIYCILRTISRGGYLYGCRSLDGGHSWSVPEATPMFGLPGHLLVLRDGRLLCAYGRRVAPFGIRACLSEDGGRTWKIDQEIVIRDDLPNNDLGYPQTVEYAPSRLFICYWGQEPDGVTCIQGTNVTLT